MSQVAHAGSHDPVATRVANSPNVWRLICEDVACVKTRDPAARGKLETLLTYPGIHAIIWHRVANWLWLHDHRFSARLVSWLCRFLTNIDIHPGATI